LAELNRYNMKKNNIIRFVQSLILLPFVTGSATPFGNIIKNPINESVQIVFTQKNNTETTALNKLADKKAKSLAIDAYFETRGMPLAGTGMKMVEEAEKNDLDWRLLPAIAIRESTGGKFACKGATYSSFGWGSCKINFDSHEENIEVVAKNLGGNNPNTARHYADKTVKQILQAYNPPSVVPRYAEQVMDIMNVIGEADEVVVIAQG